MQTTTTTTTTTQRTTVTATATATGRLIPYISFTDPEYFVLIIRPLPATFAQVLCSGDAGTQYNVCGNGGSCACEQTVGGRSQCVDSAGACGPQCATSADCGVGQSCLTAEYSGCPYNSCSTSSDVSTCGATYSTGSASRLFVRGLGLRTWISKFDARDAKVAAADGTVYYRHKVNQGAQPTGA